MENTSTDNGVGQTTFAGEVSEARIYRRGKFTTASVQTDRYILDLERLVCGKVNAVFSKTAKNFHPVQPADLYSTSRRNAVVAARQIIFHILSDQREGEHTLTSIGRLYNRDHSTVAHGISRIGSCLTRAYRPECRAFFDVKTALEARDNAS